MGVHELVATASPCDSGDFLINISQGCPASQSSLSEWSCEGEAGAAISGEFPSDFAFHTGLEDHPWWQVDLTESYPIEMIVIYNREAICPERAETIRVEISTDGQNWITVHAGYAFFEGRRSGKPLELRLGGRLRGRYVRLSLEVREYFHLSQVEVFTRADFLAIDKYCKRFGLPAVFSKDTNTQGHYRLTNINRAISWDIVGLDIDYSARFGNLLIQYIHSIQLAQKTGLKYIRMGHHELFDLEKQFSVNEITFIMKDSELPVDGLFIAGNFFNSDDFVPVLKPFMKYSPEDELADTETVQAFIVPHMLTGIPVEGESHPDDELTIHLRAGDIFNCDEGVIHGYRQPPLSFYIMVVERMRAAGRINKVRLVFEDRGNPCVDALEAWLKEKSIPFRIQNVSLRSDMSALVDAPHLVFGHGTFGYAACRLSKRIQSVHFFAPQLGGSYGHMPTIDEVYEVSDAGGAYIKAYVYGEPFGEHEGWRNTPEMRNMMLTYPIENLRCVKLPHVQAKL